MLLLFVTTADHRAPHVDRCVSPPRDSRLHWFSSFWTPSGHPAHLAPLRPVWLLTLRDRHLHLLPAESVTSYHRQEEW